MRAGIGSPSSLAQFQDAFTAALAAGDGAEAQAAGADLRVAQLVAQPAFAVYRNTVMKGCVDALQAKMIKQRQRSIAMQRARQRMMAEVPKADVIVTNPTHFAVALRYDKEKAPAPYVCAKGTEHMAFRIRELAKKHGIPIIENKPLARGLHKHCKIGQIVPNEFYKAVAEVLAFVYFLRRKRGMGGSVQTIAMPARTRPARA